MTFPVEIHYMGKSFSLHFIFESLAFIIGFRYYVFLRKKQTDIIGEENRLKIMIGVILGALIGSRLVGCLENPSEFFQSNEKLIYIFSNKTVLGGLVGGLFFTEITKKIIGEKNSSGDLYVYPIILGMIIGRIGCFLAGVSEMTYGIASDLPWAMNLGDKVLRHPVAFYEIVYLIILFLILKHLAKTKNLENGTLFQILMISYLFFRFFLDYIKPVYYFGIGLSTIQITSLVALIYYLIFFIYKFQLKAK